MTAALYEPVAICGAHAQPWPGSQEIVHCTRSPHDAGAGEPTQHRAEVNDVPLTWWT